MVTERGYRLGYEKEMQVSPSSKQENEEEWRGRMGRRRKKWRVVAPYPRTPRRLPPLDVGLAIV
eukprot:686613-Pyramimonas_sp.AAC.1